MKAFYPNDNKRLIGIVIQTTENVELKQCERMCKLYTECFAFNMKWSDRERLGGDCEVLGRGIEDKEELLFRNYISNTEYSYFGKFDACHSLFSLSLKFATNRI